ncbi:peptidylprolyl isomerase [Catenovulum adriaticum]|uniref:peptidylprolyl isomerase n=1 Tax=Catenovulum adriaticum TaxID=2984846 RepID=A0ABY7AL18_9ALTE|nr:peptidylprolyl isomerase [Catenovulum sp. TS8]WAJ70164.1 peptidylprolyl isomerase [Catenovulum sp. TS8]
MKILNIKKTLPALAVLIATASSASYATTVKIETNKGDIVINLYDETTPKTVENFLHYVNEGKYNSSFVHRSVEDFIVQAGSYTWSIQGEQEEEYVNSIEARQIDENDEDETDIFVVENEPLWSNVKGTIAMAKTSQEHSATSSWFINVADNSENLDLQSNGFTVFGEVIEGIDIVEDINDLSIYNFGGALTNLPLSDYDTETDVDQDNLVYISQVTVTADSDQEINPTPNTLIYQDNIDLVSEIKTNIDELVESAEGYLTRAEEAYTKAAEISQEKADIASAAVLKIEKNLLELDNQLDLAEQYVVDVQTAETNNESVLKIVEIRDMAAEAYYTAYDELDAAYQSVKSAEAAAEKESSGGGGAFSWLLVAIAGLTLARKANKTKV